MNLTGVTGFSGHGLTGLAMIARRLRYATGWRGYIWMSRMNNGASSQGQYFTPPQIARFMASLVDLPSTDVWAIEPAAGLGILIAALAERIVRQTKPEVAWNSL